MKDDPLKLAIVISALLLIVCTSCAGSVVAGNREKAASMGTSTDEGKEKLGFLYLLPVPEKRDDQQKTATYRVKIFDPSTRQIQQLSEISLPIGSVAADYSPTQFQYARGALFYQPSAIDRSVERVVMIDAKTGARHNVIEYSSIHDRNHIIGGYVVRATKSHIRLFFLDCIVQSFQAEPILPSATRECKLRTSSVRDAQASDSRILLDLENVFKRKDSAKSLQAYDVMRNALIIEEQRLQSNFAEPTISSYYRVQIDNLKILAMTDAEVKELAIEFANTAEGGCRAATLRDEVFNGDRVQGVYPPQIHVGCFGLEELLSSFQRKR
jgi:hypothetical protein